MKTLRLALVMLGTATASWLAAGEPATAPAGDYVPCKLHQTVNATYPARLLYRGVLRGEAWLTLEVDPTGKLADLLVTAYTHREFADEAVRAVKQWTFTPGTVKGEPIISIITLTFEFSVDGTIAYEKHYDGALPEELFNDKYVYFPHGEGSLDQKPAAINQPSPVFPKAWVQAGHTGTVTISFYIDETGQARVPSVVSNGDDLLAGAALAAVKEWRFRPPLRKGKPVLARAEQMFVFEPPKRVESKS